MFTPVFATITPPEQTQIATCIIVSARYRLALRPSEKSRKSPLKQTSRALLIINKAFFRSIIGTALEQALMSGCWESTDRWGSLLGK